MPHLQFEASVSIDPAAKRAFIEWVADRYAETMDTTTGHIAVTIRERENESLSPGRAAEGPVAILNADIRGGRSATQRRAFATAVIEALEARFEIPADHVYVVYSEHPGEDFHLSEGPLESWGPDDDPGASEE